MLNQHRIPLLLSEEDQGFSPSDQSIRIVVDRANELEICPDVYYSCGVFCFLEVSALLEESVR
jgi:hypothetical protein